MYTCIVCVHIQTVSSRVDAEGDRRACKRPECLAHACGQRCHHLPTKTNWSTPATQPPHAYAPDKKPRWP